MSIAWSGHLDPLSIAAITVRIVLDEPRRVHVGPNDFVTGNVVVCQRPTKVGSLELFGPLRITVTLHGRAKSKVWQKSGNHNHMYRGRASLFSTMYTIHDGPFKAQAEEQYSFPFALQFPNGAQDYSFESAWEKDGRFNTAVGHPLPPSFDIDYRGFVHHFVGFVEYRLGTQVAMPGIKVNIFGTGLDKNSESVIHYEPVGVPRTAMLSQPVRNKAYVEIRNQLLLPEEDRPSGFKEKTRALLKSDYYPKYCFDVESTSKKDVYIGDCMSFQFRVKVHEERSTAVVRPEIRVKDFGVELLAYTCVRAEKRMFSSPESSTEETMSVLRAAPAVFSNENDWTKTIETGALGRFPPSFATYNVLRTYSIRYRFTISCAEKDTNIKWEHPVTVHPPLVDETPMVEAGPSSQPLENMDGLEQDLPVYERPPGYEEEAPSPLPTADAEVQ